MGKTGGGSGGLSADEMRRKLDEYIDSGSLQMVTNQELVARSNGMIKVDLTARTVPDFTPYVNAGAKLLDEKDPGWWRAIDTSSLNLDDENHCVLGQSWSHYNQRHNLGLPVETEPGDTTKNRGYTTNFHRFLRRLFPDLRLQSSYVGTPAEYGFALTEAVNVWVWVEWNRRVEEGTMPPHRYGSRERHGTWQVNAECWEMLTKTWLVLIEARQKAFAAQVEQMLLEVRNMTDHEIAERLAEATI